MKMKFTAILFIHIYFLNLLISIDLSGVPVGYDTTRIYNAMAKARRGEGITIGVIGGSITQGYAASSENTRWANLMSKWWENSFPKAKVTLINAGIGATGSDIGAFRVQDDLLKNKPDFVVVEFSVNDPECTFASKTMEGLIRQILVDSNHPGVMMLILKQSNGTSALNSHKPVSEHYGVPVISFAELIDGQVAKDGVLLSSVYLSDGLHLVDAGMKYAAQFITDELTRIYNKLPAADANIPAISTQLPSPLFTDMYASTVKYNCTNLMPDLNNGWQLGTNDWHSSTIGSEMTFTVDGNIAAILYSRDNTSERGMAEVWVDNGAHQLLDAYWANDWGTTIVFNLINEALADGYHKVHIKVVSGNTAGSAGHYFQLLNVLKAGHFTNVPVPGEDYKIKIYPVPIHDVLFVDYYLAQQEMVDISLFSMTGKLIATLKHEQQTPGQHQLQFNTDPQSLVVGIYILRLQINQKQVNKKIIIRQ